MTTEHAPWAAKVERAMGQIDDFAAWLRKRQIYARHRRPGDTYVLFATTRTNKGEPALEDVATMRICREGGGGVGGRVYVTPLTKEAAEWLEKA